MDFPGSSVGKESTCNIGHPSSISGLGRPPGGGHGNPLHYSCLENPHGQRSLAGYSPWGRRIRHNWVTEHSTARVLCIHEIVHLSFSDWCISLSIVSSGLVVFVGLSFWRLHDSPLCVGTIFCLPVYALMVTWVASTFWLLWMKLFWMWVYTQMPV